MEITQVGGAAICTPYFLEKLKERMLVDYRGMVEDFHRKYGAYIGRKPSFPPDLVIKLRIDLIEEELQELKDAIAQKDIVKVADALADLKYVVFGTDVAFGLPADDIFAEVHRSNMSKTLMGDPSIIHKIQKGPDYIPPDIASIIRFDLVHDMAEEQ